MNFSDNFKENMDLTFNSNFGQVMKQNISDNGNKQKDSRIENVEILSSLWQGEESPYSQIVKIDGVTKNTQVDLTPSVEQLSIFYNKDLCFVTENKGGIVFVYAIGQKPQNDYTIQATLTEVRK